MGQRHVGTAVHLGDPQRSHLVEAGDDFLHPEIAEDERLELERRAEKSEEALAVDVHGERLLANDFALDLFQPTRPKLEIRPHGPYRATPVGKDKGPRVGARVAVRSRAPPQVLAITMT